MRSRSDLVRYWARVSVAALEIAVVLLAVLLLLALLRQMVTIGYLVMGHDDDYYLAVARNVAAGLVPYRDFSFEYPPLALLPIVLPVVAWLPGGLDGASYTALLALENVAVVVASAACLVWLARRGWSDHRPRTTLLIYVGLVFATPILFWRFDALPAFLSILGLCAFAGARLGWAGLALAGGALFKLYPIVMLPILGLAPVLEGKRRAALRLAAGAIVPLAVVSAMMFAGAGGAGLSFLGYQTTRGVQLESIPASVALVAHSLWGTPAHAFPGYGSLQLESPLLDQIGWVWPVLAGFMIAGLLVSALGAYRLDLKAYGHVRPQSQVGQLVAAIVLVLVSYRVLSPQYLVWLLPFAALLPRHKVMTVLAICVLTLYVFPFAGEGLFNLRPDAIAALALRNSLLVLLFVWQVAPGVRQAVSASRLRARTRRTPERDQGAFGSM